ncbi:hypothetical protein [Sporomusa malonica]
MAEYVWQMEMTDRMRLERHGVAVDVISTCGQGTTIIIRFRRNRK